MFKLPENWAFALQNETEKEYFKELLVFLESEYQNKTIFPPKELVFEAFRLTSLENTKVVIIGQDPYHGHHQAHGLSFSVNEGIALPPSLINIFKEIESDLGISIPISGNLSRWAEQGVLLLNATLTVEAHKAGSHQNKGWETFTDTVIQTISREKEKVVFLLWGGFAKKKASLIDADKHYILTSGHPSPLSANRGLWFENKHFSKANELLKQSGQDPIDWKTDCPWG